METPTFDYILDDGLRAELEAAATELRAVLRARAPRAATLLAGGVVERVIRDSLSRLGMAPTADLAGLLDAAVGVGALSARAREAATVLQGYRTLLDIDPAPAVPLLRDLHGATVAVALVGLVDAELSAFLFAHAEPTALQVQRRMADGALPATFAELIGRMRSEELQRLLGALIDQLPLPHGWERANSPADSRSLVYRMAFAALPNDDKPEIAHRLATLLVDPAHEGRVAPLFRSSDLRYVCDAQTREAVVRYLLHRIASLSRGNSQISEGLGAELRVEEAAALVDAAATAAMSNSRTDEGFQIVEREFTAMGPQQRDRVQAQVRTWVKYYDDQRMPIVANELRQFELRLRNPALHR